MKICRFIFLFGVLFTSSKLMASVLSNKIIRGSDSPSYLKSSIINISYAGDSKFCTATAIGPKVILTAAHCTSDRVYGLLPGRRERTEFKTIRHPHLDVAVGILGDKNFLHYPVAIASPSFLNDPHGEVLFAGYGCKSFNPDVHDRRLRVGRNVIGEVSSSHFALKNPNGSMGCFGDSGGPAFFHGRNGVRVVGVQSGVRVRGGVIVNSFFVRLSSVLKFLEDVGKANEVKICGVNSSC